MIPPSEHARRRQELRRRLGRPILLLGNGPRARNLPGYGLPFRQDSTFLYFTGCTLPDAAALLDEDGYTLFLRSPGPEDALWHGPVPGLEEQGVLHGADHVREASELRGAVAGRSVLTLAIPDEAGNRLLSEITGRPHAFGRHYGSPELVQAVIEMRRAKSAVEIEEMREAGRHTRVAFEAVMRGTSPDGHERVLNALFEGVLAARGLTVGYDTILTQSGEILHHHAHDEPLEPGRLVLLDGGGELPTGYGVDITRTWPVTGHFDERQAAVYDAVLAAQSAAIELCRPGVRYREVHDTASRVLASFLHDEGLIRCSAEEAVATGAHALFFPHGVGHHLGMDVHDLENFGDLPSYPSDQTRPDQFGTRNLRLDLPLEPGWVVTIEPGLYFVPTILGDAALRDRFRDLVDFDMAERWLGFGGVRIEDDIHVTTNGPDLLTDVPRTRTELERLVGSGTPAHELLCWGR